MTRSVGQGSLLVVVCVVLVSALVQQAQALFPIDLPVYETGYLVRTKYGDDGCADMSLNTAYYTALGVCSPVLPFEGNYTRVTLQQSPISNSFSRITYMYSDNECMDLERTETEVIDTICHKGSDDDTDDFNQGSFRYAYLADFSTQEDSSGVLVKQYATSNDCVNDEEFAFAVFYASPATNDTVCNSTGHYVDGFDLETAYMFHTETGEGDFLGHRVGRAMFNPDECGDLEVFGAESYLIDCDATAASNHIPTRTSTVGMLIASDYVDNDEDTNSVMVDDAEEKNYLVQSYFEDITECDGSEISWQAIYTFERCMPIATMDYSYALMHYGTLEAHDTTYSNLTVAYFADSNCSTVVESSEGEFILEEVLTATFGRGNFSCIGHECEFLVRESQCGEGAHLTGAKLSTVSKFPDLSYNVLYNAYASEESCLAETDSIKTVTYTKNKCLPISSPFAFNVDEAAEITGCTDTYYTVKTYADNECEEETGPMTYVVPRYSCAYVEGMGFVSTSCNFVSHDDSVTIPKDAIYSLLLLLLLLPLIVYGLLKLCQIFTNRESSYRETEAVPAKPHAEAPEEGDMEMN